MKKGKKNSRVNMKRISLILMIICLSAIYIYTNGNETKVTFNEETLEMDISEVDISEADISETDISEADISETDISEEDISEEDISEAQFVENELIAAVDSLEEAENIAVEYALELESYSYGVAVYKCEDSIACLDEIMESEAGKETGLELNKIYTLYETEIETQQVTSTNASQYYLDELNVEEAWETSTGADVTVAVIDTGVDTDHSELENSISELSYNSYTDKIGVAEVEDDHGHGTHVSGIIAGTLDSNSKVYGISPAVELLIIKADRPSDNNFEMVSLVRAVNYATANGADVINMSVGSSYSDGASTSLEKAITDAVDAGVTVVCAAGNDSDDHASYPAAYEDTIAVSALKSGYEFDDSYSNYGLEIDISAQGTAIYSTYLNNGYAIASGTSMACPVVSAIAALIKSVNPDYSPTEVKEALCESAQDAGDLGWDSYYGYGVVNAYAAVLEQEDLYEITYDYNDEDRADVVTQAAPGATVIEPNEPTGATEFLGWSLEEESDEYFVFGQAMTEDIILYAQWEKTYGSVSGVIQSYNPQNTATIMLVQDSEIMYSLETEVLNISGEAEQEFLFSSVLEGVYDLVVEKEFHTTYTIEGISVTQDGVDLTESSVEEIQKIILKCGDLNGDGSINQTDLNILWLPSNYNQVLDEVINNSGDLNGDGFINQTDLNILWLPMNYNQGTVTVDIALAASVEETDLYECFLTSDTAPVAVTVDAVAEVSGIVDTLVIDWKVTATEEDVSLRGSSGLRLAYDAEKLQLVEEGNLSSEITVTTTLTPNNTAAGYVDWGEEESFLNTYVAESADGITGYITLEIGSPTSELACSIEEVVTLASMVFVYRDGYSAEDLTEDSIRVMTVDELNTYNQSATANILVEDGDTNTEYSYNTTTEGTEDNLIEPTINLLYSASITTTSLSAGVYGTAYSETLAATGTSGITWSITNGTLPEGLSLNSATGEITGTPMEVIEQCTFTVKAENVAGASSKDFTITISKADAAIPVEPVTESITSSSVEIEYVEGQKYMIQLASEEGPSITSAGWGDSVEFEGLEANTAYIIYTYISKTDTTNASDIVSIEITTSKITSTVKSSEEDEEDEEDEDEEEYMCGDATGDGKISSADYIAIKNHIMGTKTIANKYQDGADANQDGKISSADYIAIKNHIMGTKLIK